MTGSALIYLQRKSLQNIGHSDLTLKGMNMTDGANRCRICENADGNETYRVREMLLGTREEFEYFECAACGCLQLSVIPEDLSQFYPPGYCCHKDYRKRVRNGFRRVVDTLRVNASLPEDGVISGFFNSVAPPLDYLPWIQYTGLNRDSRVLDVGCGGGKLLMRMSMGGFKSLHGIDPFIAEDLQVRGVRIDRISIPEHIDQKPERYQLVILNHVFEHVPDPFETLEQMKSLMDPDGYLLVRVPVADSYSREHYGVNWYSWDPPRHTYLHTMQSMKLVAEQTGFVIRKVQHDATFHQLRNSELYTQGIPGNQHATVLDRFSAAQIREFKTRTRRLNEEQRGEQAAFFLQLSDAVSQSTRRAA